MGECNHNWEWDIYRKPKNPKLFRKRYECKKCRKVKYSNLIEQHKVIDSNREIIAQAHMDGQCDAGIDPSYSNALNYAEKLLGENNDR